MKASRIFLAILACTLLFSSCTKLSREEAKKEVQRRIEEETKRLEENKGKNDKYIVRDKNGNPQCPGIENEMPAL